MTCFNKSNKKKSTKTQNNVVIVQFLQDFLNFIVDVMSVRGH